MSKTPIDLDSLRLNIDEADHQYHTLGNSPITDHEYDRWKLQLREVAPNDVRFTRVGSPVMGLVSVDPTERGRILTKARHSIPMGSLTNAMNEQELRAWAASHPPGTSYMVQPKGDGFSLALYYKDGKLDRAITRGDGEEGEDITANARLFAQVPQTLKDDAFNDVIRGEVMLLKSQWRELDPDATSNPRNMAAGIGRRKDGSDANALSFFSFEMATPEGIAGSRLDGNAALMGMMGFTPLPFETFRTIDEVIEAQVKLGQTRESLDYLLDGAVVKVNDVQQLTDMGTVGRCPRGMIAFKWEAEVVTTLLKGVTWQIGHTGKVSPVAKLHPVRIGGVTVSSALLCNMQEIKRLGVKINSTVNIIRAGEVIPKIIGLASEQKTIGTLGDTTIHAPTEIDGYTVTARKNTDGSDTVDLYVDPAHPTVQRGKIQNWIKKLDIQGVGDEVLDALMATDDWLADGKLVDSIVSLYTLFSSYRDTYVGENLLVNGKKLGVKRANSIMKAIDKTRTLTIDQFLGSLGINGLGRRRVQLIREAWQKHVDATKIGDAFDGVFNYIDSWFSHTATPANDMISRLVAYAPQLGIPGIAESLQAGIDEMKPVITELLKHITIESPRKPVASDDLIKSDHVLRGKSICFSGVRPTDDQTSHLEAIGVIVKSGVSKGLDYLCVKDPSSTSSKTTKARELGTQIISHDTFGGWFTGGAA